MRAVREVQPNRAAAARSRAVPDATRAVLDATRRRLPAAHPAQRGPRREDLGVDSQLEDRRDAGTERPLERRGELARALDGLAVGAEAARPGGEVGVVQVRRVRAPRVAAA